VRTEAHRLENAHTAALTVRACQMRTHDLVHVHVLGRQRVQAIEPEGFVAQRQLTLPQAVAPLGVVVAQALGQQGGQRLQLDAPGRAVAVFEPQRAAVGVARAGLPAQIELGLRNLALTRVGPGGSARIGVSRLPVGGKLRRPPARVFEG
jgi:hypothetical protein